MDENGYFRIRRNNMSIKYVCHRKSDNIWIGIAITNYKQLLSTH